MCSFCILGVPPGAFFREFCRMGVPPTFGPQKWFPKTLFSFPNKWIPEMGVPPAISSKLLSFFFDRAWYQLFFQKEILNCPGARQSDTEERCYFKVELQMACQW